MNSKEVELLDELLQYAEEIRGDWSGFDGRDLLLFIKDWIHRFYEVI